MYGNMNVKKDVTSRPRASKRASKVAESGPRYESAPPLGEDERAPRRAACERSSVDVSSSSAAGRTSSDYDHVSRLATTTRDGGGETPDEEAPNVNMFRDGQYLEVIKASDDCLATAVVTVQERTVEIKKRKVTTNKWLQVEDWAALYKILERAVLRNRRQGDGLHREDRRREWRKSTRQLEVTYTFEYPESASDMSFLPTIKVHVSQARKKPVKREACDETASKRSKVKTDDVATKRTKEEKSPVRTTTKADRLKKTPEKSTQISPKKTETPSATATGQGDLKRKKCRTYTLSGDLGNDLLEEYIPDAPKTKKSCPDFKYVPSRKSALENMRLTSNEYTPTLCDGKGRVAEDVSYVPNSVEKLETNYEIYEPRATTIIPDSVFEEYVPNSKGLNPSIEEYEPDFKSPSKLMKFDDSYVPSSVRRNAPNDSKRTPSKPEKSKMQRLEARKGTIDKKKMNLFS